MKEFFTRKCGGKLIAESDLVVGQTVWGIHEGKKAPFVCVVAGQAVLRSEHIRNKVRRFFQGWVAGSEVRGSHAAAGIYPRR